MSAPSPDGPVLSISGRDAFRIAVCVLHVVGAIVATVFCFTCDASKSRQLATVPFALPLSVSPLRNMSQARQARTAFPWGEDEEETHHVWNPFLLVLAFEWLTAGFAMSNLGLLAPVIFWPTIAWLGIGLAVVIAWLALNTGAIGLAMPIIVVGSFVTTGVLCLRFEMNRPFVMRASSAADKPHPLVPSIMDGRTWLVPRTIGALKKQPIFKEDTREAKLQEYDQFQGILNRYAEYCVTAPLLFIAVTCLLVTDAPSWLFVTGYLFLVGCNLFGVLLHYTTMSIYLTDSAKKNDDARVVSWWGYASDTIYTATWRSAGSKRLYLLNGAWLSLLLPMSGLVYMTRGYLFSSELPGLVAFMIWNLLLTYSLFGILPTYVYLTWTGFGRLDLILDVLNAVAKFPIPMQILIGYVTRPAGVHLCFS